MIQAVFKIFTPKSERKKKAQSNNQPEKTCK